jgi:hypothetical protein
LTSPEKIRLVLDHIDGSTMDKPFFTADEAVEERLASFKQGCREGDYTHET